MKIDAALILVTFMLIVLFKGEPDLHDAIIVHLIK